MKVYLDNAASTPLDREVYNAMTPYLLDQYGTPSTHHGYGRDAKAAVEISRVGIAKLLNASPEEIIFTSGATEADNIAILSAVNCALIDHIITTPFEHQAVLQSLNALQRKHDIRISYIRHDERGNLDLNHLEYLLRTNTRNFVSVMHANNEIGNLNDIETIGRLCEKYKALFHTDAAQTVGKYTHDLANLNVNFLAASAHKFHGPKGIGFLYCRKGTRHISGLNGQGTENVPGIVGISKALAIACEEMEAQHIKIQGLKNRMITQLSELLPTVTFNGNSGIAAKSISSILNVNLPHTNMNRSFAQYLDEHQIAASGGQGAPSHVLKALGIANNAESIRFSFSKFNTIQEIDHVAEVIASVYQTVAA
ncbi:cysteine desulfurase [Mucilaginibacter sp. BJC16-A38]|uniref:cysteine desulfurase family protein n=1 Tax=Mucilaginibacter phenanthrenivorans TaxID=1234842 RepID=UPI00215898DA|nr:cysteine desulfurase family protein [Mucilaginibacter phenanthrenivorans]MCR8559629.1 cysteine desulfurase [Mucilaginibacter phenanthrenivorans]